MEKSSSQDGPENTLKFYCHLCSVYCASAMNLQIHFLGVKHKKVEDALRKHVAAGGQGGQEVKEEVLPVDLKPNVTLQEHIDACKDSEPAIGLEYVYQYQRLGYNMYECKLCDCQAGLSIMFMHVVGAKHRINYLDKHHPTLGFRVPFAMRARKLNKLREACYKVEREFGRQKIQVVDGIDSQWTFNTDTTCERTSYVPDTEPGKVDFTSDDVFNTEKKPEATEDKPEELKAACEESQKALSDNIEVSSEAEELLKSEQGFRNSKELFNYLERFTIVEEEDVKFVNTVVEMLTMALQRHHKSLTEKKLSKSDATIEQDKCKEQVPAPSNQESQNQSKTQLHPIPKAGDRKKLKFTLSNQAQTVPESEENFAPEAESNGPTTTFNPTANVFTKDRKREESEENFAPEAPESNGRTTTFNPTANVFTKDSKRKDIPETNTQNQNSAASQYNKKPNSEPQPSSSLVSVQTPAYPPPQVNIRPPQVNIRPPQVNIRPPQVNIRPPQVNIRPPQVNIRPPQVNIRPPSAQTRFAPPHATLPSRPPLFPIAKDDAVNQFFESIKTMDVGEVASTLSRISATNPAFKGINVPSLIRYLTETGKLKTPQSTQQMNQ